MGPAGNTLEREQELDVISAALDAAALGQGRTLIVEGPAGIGKTRLVRDARALAKVRGFGRIQATGDELEAAMAWSVVRQLVERSILRYSGETRKALLAGPSGSALRALGEAPAEAPAGDADLARTQHALWWVAADLASFRPLLITVDDAQWADVPSLRFLAYLSRRIADLPILLVVGTRPPHGHSGPLTDLIATRDAEHLRPAPLSSGAVAELGADGGRLPAPEVVSAVHAASGGNPFLARLLLDELAARGMALDDAATAARVGSVGPSAISRTLLARLPADATALAAAAAVLGAQCEPWLAGAVAELDDARLADATDVLADGHVMADGPDDQLAFVHPVIREAVLAQLARGERAVLHARAARTLHGSGAPAARVAAHLVAAPLGTLPEAAALLSDVGARLLADGDAATAAAHLARALEESPRDDALQAQLGAALLRTGDGAPAREHLRSAARATADPLERATRLASAAAATSMVDGPTAAVAELRALLDGTPGAPDAPDRLVLEARLATICSPLATETKRMAERLARLSSLTGASREERQLLALAAQRARYDVRPAREVRDLGLRALGEGALLEDAASTFDGMIVWMIAVLSTLSGEGTDAVAAELDRARARILGHGSPLEFGMLSLAAGWYHWRTGDVAGTEADAEAAMAALADEPSSPPVAAGRATALHGWALAMFERGEREAVAEALRAYDAGAADRPRTLIDTSLREPRALLALAHDAPARALQEALTLGDEARAAGIDTPTIAWRAIAAVASLALGRDEQARAYAADHLALAERSGTATDVGAALRIRARVDREERLALLGDAVAVLDGSPARLELARALVDQGEALRVDRQRRAAHAPLERAAALAHACRAPVLRRRAVEGLAALGDQPRKLMFSGEESLTASERRVARLAIDGRSNRTIAQELFVTPKTVENHLGRVYMKLGITSRRQLADSLA